jgi:hypothetical protein
MGSLTGGHVAPVNLIDVVGASPGVFSYIQNIHYQLTAIGSHSGFSAIALS